jgi:hypothetical protein
VVTTFRLNRVFLGACLLVGCGLAACSRKPPQKTEKQAEEKQSAEVGESKLEPGQGIPDLKPKQVDALESIVSKDPKNLQARGMLMNFYWLGGDKMLGQQATIEARRKHILWIIQNHPEDKAARSGGGLILTRPGDADPDPAGYQEGKKLWLAQVEKPDAPASVLTAAARFFRENDKPLTEKMLLRLQALQPQNRWTSELGALYYEILVGSRATDLDGKVRLVNLADAHSPYANEIRDKLSHSTDVTLLVMTAKSLGMWGRTLYENHSLDFDPVALARTYLDKALQVDSQSILAHQIALNIRFLDRGGQTVTIPQGSSAEAQYQALEALPEEHRYFRMSLLAEAAYTNAEALEAGPHDAASAKAALETARKSAQEVLQLAPKFPGDPDSGTALYNADMVLGLLAVGDRNRKAAVRFMMDASNVPSTEELAYGGNDFSFKLPERLYQDGERDSVADFLERFAQGNVSQKGYLVESAKAIRNGKKPLWVMN